ncbi:MAG: hypothetical protein ACF8PN_14345 [Phycisphaerales bacterium]
MTDSNPERKSVMRSLGEFVGHIWWGVRHDPSKKRTIIDKKVTERREGKVTLRETIVREIEVDHDDAPRE